MKRTRNSDDKNRSVQRLVGFARGQARSNFNRMLIFFCVPFLVFILSVILVLNRYLYAGITIWAFLPLSRLLMIGSIRARLRNALPFAIGLIYLMVGLETGEWERWMVLLFLVPFLSLLMKPKRHPLAYATLGVSVIVLAVNYLTRFDIPVYGKWAVVALIYLIFLPPLVKKRIKELFHGQKHVEKKR
ncbi:MAG: hypothetical protein ACLFSU_06075 [Acholeplasmataceae bacterium]